MHRRAATSDWSNFACSRRLRIKSRRILRSLCLRAGRTDFRAIGREYTGVLTYIPKWTSTYWTIRRHEFGICIKPEPTVGCSAWQGLRVPSSNLSAMVLTEAISSPRMLTNRAWHEAVWCRVVDAGLES